MCVYVFVIVGVCKCVPAYMCMYVCVRVCACVCSCVCLCVCFLVCVFVCLYETLCAGTAGYSDPRIWDRGAAAAVLNPHPTPPCRGVPSFLGTEIHAILFAELFIIHFSSWGLGLVWKTKANDVTSFEGHWKGGRPCWREGAL